MAKFPKIIIARDDVAALVQNVLGKIPRSDALLILPPFAGIDRPSLGLHTLQACARERGLAVPIFYANIILATFIGEKRYEELCYAPTADLLGERIFAPAAYGENYTQEQQHLGESFRTSLRAIDLVSLEELNDLQAFATMFTDVLGECIAQFKFAVVGCNTTFEQTSAAIATLNAVKRYAPLTITIIGGANCEGEMAHGILKLSTAINYIFSGESETTFPDFLDVKNKIAEGLPQIIEGTPCKDLDALPDLNYEDYYRQLQLLPEDGFVRRSGSIWLPYETSRGCWWGQKHHCTFCGINGGGMTFREKSPGRVLKQLPALFHSHPTAKILMVDNIMPSGYFANLLPELSRLNLGMHIFYEQKANLTLAKVQALKDAGVAIIQPGIEALSSHLLKLMKKGVKASQNIALLRYARAVDMSVNWNLLYGLPGDNEEDYMATLELIPLLWHLNPPSGACHLSIDRFSPYFDRPADYGITNIRPMDAYLSIFPPSVPVDSIAYHFVGDYDTACRRAPMLVSSLQNGIECWRSLWNQPEKKPPVLLIEEMDQENYLLIDTRCEDSEKHVVSFIDKQKASVALVGTRREFADDPVCSWALRESKVAVELDGMIVPLATARAELLLRFEKESRSKLELNSIHLLLQA